MINCVDLEMLYGVVDTVVVFFYREVRIFTSVFVMSMGTLFYRTVVFWFSVLI